MSIIKGIRVGLIAVLAGALSASMAVSMEWDLSGVRTIELDGVSGDIEIRPASGAGRVELAQNIKSGSFEGMGELRGSTLSLSEEWGRGSSSGDVKWTFYVDEGMEVRVHTASGSLDARDISMGLEFESASGDIELDNVELAGDSSLSTASGDYRIKRMAIRDGARFQTASGDIDLDDVQIEEGATFTTASGDVTARRCDGHLSLKSASGDVVLRDSNITGGSFSSASGNVSLYLSHIPYDGLAASSASGDVLLDAADFGGDYTLIMTANKKRGDINCPFAITSSRTYERGRETYEEQIVELGSGGPELDLQTGSGRVTVRN